MRCSARSVISTLSPVSRIKLGMSMTDKGSVQCTSSRSPGFNGFSALRVFSAGSGHFNPVRSSLVVVMVLPLLHQIGIAEEADRRARLDSGDGFRQFDQ